MVINVGKVIFTYKKIRLRQTKWDLFSFQVLPKEEVCVKTRFLFSNIKYFGFTKKCTWFQRMDVTDFPKIPRHYRRYLFMIELKFSILCPPPPPVSPFSINFIFSFLKWAHISLSVTRVSQLNSYLFYLHKSRRFSPHVHHQSIKYNALGQRSQILINKIENHMIIMMAPITMKLWVMPLQTIIMIMKTIII